MVEAIFKHRSIRKYTDKPVSEDLLNHILQGGIRAATTGNMQVYSILVSRSEEKKKQLWEAHFKQDMVREAPVVLTFCADVNRFHKWCDYRKAERAYDNFLWFFTAAIDALLVAQNVAVEAEDNGLGTCYLGTTTYMSRKIIDILELPQGVVPVTTLTLGFPAEDPKLTDRLPLEGIVHEESYKQYSRQAIDEIYAEKEALEETRQLLEENDKETLAQVFTDNRYRKQDNLHFSREFLDVIRQQGFMNNE